VDKDFIISACRWHVDPEARRYKQRALEHYRDCWTVLLDFLRTNGLLSDPNFGRNMRDWMTFEIRVSDLTEEGLALCKMCLGTWNPSFGQGHTQRHLVQWKRKLAKLRGP
jgi:hypothetical protein